MHSTTNTSTVYSRYNRMLFCSQPMQFTEHESKEGKGVIICISIALSKIVRSIVEMIAWSVEAASAIHQTQIQKRKTGVAVICMPIAMSKTVTSQSVRYLCSTYISKVKWTKKIQGPNKENNFRVIKILKKAKWKLNQLYLLLGGACNLIGLAHIWGHLELSIE